MDAKRTVQTEQLARELASQAGSIDELNGLLRGLMKSALECLLDAEMAAPLKCQDPPSRHSPALPYFARDTLTNRSHAFSASARPRLHSITARIGAPPWAIGTGRPDWSGTVMCGSMPSSA
jgi:hypothetical protein